MFLLPALTGKKNAMYSIGKKILGKFDSVSH